MDSFARAIAAMNDLKREGIVTEYAIGGAMAIIFWSEPTATFDLDVFVLLKEDGALDEHIIIAGLPVQVIPAHNALAAEAVRAAVDREYLGESVRVMRPEHLIAMVLEPAARTRKRLERVAALLDEGNVDRDLLLEIVERYRLQLPP